jgi:EAL domain-containing protein (putative c-di-GMP-specific phosphodiesterase class I)
MGVQQPSENATKPVDVDEVLLRVRNLLALRLSHEALKNSNSALATTLQQQMQSEEYQSVNRNDRIKAVRGMIASGPRMVFQPIITLDTNHPVGFEALARFDSSRPPDNWFAEATSLGLGAELELSAVNAAFEHFDLFAAEEFIAVNVSPAVMLDDRFYDLVHKHGRDRVVIEITNINPSTTTTTSKASAQISAATGSASRSTTPAPATPACTTF